MSRWSQVTWVIARKKRGGAGGRKVRAPRREVGKRPPSKGVVVVETPLRGPCRRHLGLPSATTCAHKVLGGVGGCMHIQKAERRERERDTRTRSKLHASRTVPTHKMNYKRVQHQDFPGGHPSQYCSGPSALNCGVLMGSGVLALV